MKGLFGDDLPEPAGPSMTADDVISFDVAAAKELERIRRQDVAVRAYNADLLAPGHERLIEEAVAIFGLIWAAVDEGERIILARVGREAGVTRQTTIGKSNRQAVRNAFARLPAEMRVTPLAKRTLNELEKLLEDAPHKPGYEAIRKHLKAMLRAGDLPK